MRRLIPTFGKRTKTAAKPPETGVVRPRRLPRVKVIVWSVLGVTTACMAAYTAFNQDLVRDEVIALSGKAGLQLQIIEVEGRANTPSDLLLAASELRRGQPIYDIDLKSLHGRIAEIGWVADVTVERRMPSTIHIKLQERIPVALIQTAAGHELIDQSGAVITGAAAEDFAHLTVVSGQGAAAQAGQMLDLLRTEPELFANVWAISLQSGRRWDVHLRNGIDIRLPEIDPRTAWSRLAMMDHSKNITRRDLAVIDLRIPNQLIVEPNIPVRGKGRKT